VRGTAVSLTLVQWMCYAVFALKWGRIKKEVIISPQITYMSVLNGTTAVQVLFKKVSSTLDAWGFNFLHATFC